MKLKRYFLFTAYRVHQQKKSPPTSHRPSVSPPPTAAPEFELGFSGCQVPGAEAGVCEALVALARSSVGREGCRPRVAESRVRGGASLDGDRRGVPSQSQRHQSSQYHLAALRNTTLSQRWGAIFQQDSGAYRCAVAPAFDQLQRWTQGLALSGHPIFLTPCAGTDRELHEDSLLDQLGKASREDVAGNTQTAMEIVEAGGPVQGRPHDQHAPAVANLANSAVHATTFDTHYLVHGSPLLVIEPSSFTQRTLANHNLNDSAFPLIRQ